MSNLLYNLEIRIQELEKLFLPQQRSSTGDYTKEQYDLVSAFCMFVHAEIESCIENLIKEIVLEKYQKIEEGDLSDLSFIWNLFRWYLFCAPNAELSNRQQKIAGNFKKKDFLGVLKECNQYFFLYIKNNHGIKTDNLKNMLFPLGIDPQEWNATWCANMDSFGSFRGERAHNCVGAYNPMDPFDAKNLVSDLIKGIKELETSMRQNLFN